MDIDHVSLAFSTRAAQAFFRTRRKEAAGGNVDDMAQERHIGHGGHPFSALPLAPRRFAHAKLIRRLVDEESAGFPPEPEIGCELLDLATRLGQIATDFRVELTWPVMTSGLSTGRIIVHSVFLSRPRL